jgi:hypothetical protein
MITNGPRDSIAQPDEGLGSSRGDRSAVPFPLPPLSDIPHPDPEPRIRTSFFFSSFVVPKPQASIQLISSFILIADMRRIAVEGQQP